MARTTNRSFNASSSSSTAFPVPASAAASSSTFLDSADSGGTDEISNTSQYRFGTTERALNRNSGANIRLNPKPTQNDTSIGNSKGGKRGKFKGSKGPNFNFGGQEDEGVPPLDDYSSDGEGEETGED